MVRTPPRTDAGCSSSGPSAARKRLPISATSPSQPKRSRETYLVRVQVANPAVLREARAAGFAAERTRRLALLAHARKLMTSSLPIPTAWYAIPLRLIVGFGFMRHGYAKL